MEEDKEEEDVIYSKLGNSVSAHLTEVAPHMCKIKKNNPALLLTGKHMFLGLMKGIHLSLRWYPRCRRDTSLRSGCLWGTYGLLPQGCCHGWKSLGVSTGGSYGSGMFVLSLEGNRRLMGIAAERYMSSLESDGKVGCWILGGRGSIQALPRCFMWYV